MHLQEIFQFFQDLKSSLNPSYHEEIQEFQDRILYYLAHQTRKTYLNAQFSAALLELNEDGAILVVDYKIKTFLEKKIRYYIQYCYIPNLKNVLKSTYKQ